MQTRGYRHIAAQLKQRPLVWVVLAIIFLLTTAACAGRFVPSDLSANYEGTAFSEPAPNFRLVDQNGNSIALSDFQGQVVVLTFMDSQCQEVCPLTAVHLRQANQSLRSTARSVVFLAVNTNVAANGVTDVATATQTWRLDEIDNWHFLTGSAAELEPVWAAYDVGVVAATEEDEELRHTSGVFLIDQDGQKRWYVSTPFVETDTSPGFMPLSDLLVKHIQALVREG